MLIKNGSHLRIDLGEAPALKMRGISVLKETFVPDFIDIKHTACISFPTDTIIHTCINNLDASSVLLMIDIISSRKC